jgi:hypothetical protein
MHISTRRAETGHSLRERNELVDYRKVGVHYISWTGEFTVYLNSHCLRYHTLFEALETSCSNHTTVPSVRIGHAWTHELFKKWCNLVKSNSIASFLKIFKPCELDRF